MPPALTLAQAETPQIQSTALFLTVIVLLALGLVGWLAATVVGFARARAGRGAVWFALASLCLLAYHLQWIVFALVGRNATDMQGLLNFGSFFNLFVFVGSIFAVVGFLRLGDPRA
jgi:4-hydroxybenzoate polyprenyltransferase